MCLNWLAPFATSCCHIPRIRFGTADYKMTKKTKLHSMRPSSGPIDDTCNCVPYSDRRSRRSNLEEIAVALTKCIPAQHE